MWQVLLCFVAFASAAPDYSLEDFDDYYFRHRFVPQISQYHVAPVHLVKAFPALKAYSGPQQTADHSKPQVKKAAEDPRVDVTHVRNPGQQQQPRVVRQPPQQFIYRKFDFDDDDDDDRIYFGRAGPTQYRTGGSPGFYRYDDDDDDDDDRIFFGGRFRPLVTTYSSPGNRPIRYYDDDLFDFDDK